MLANSCEWRALRVGGAVFEPRGRVADQGEDLEQVFEDAVGVGGDFGMGGDGAEESAALGEDGLEDLVGQEVVLPRCSRSRCGRGWPGRPCRGRPRIPLPGNCIVDWVSLRSTQPCHVIVQGRTRSAALFRR